MISFHDRQGQHRSNGFALLPVVLAVLTIAAIAILVSGETAMETRLRAGEFERSLADLSARGGIEQALWLYDGLGCAAYPDINSGSIGDASYDVSVTPTAGSPITLAATATLGSATSVTVTVSDQRVFDPAPATMVLQPGAEGKDVYLRKFKPTWNYGAAPDIYVNDAALRHGLIEFDLSTFPSAARLVSATLELYTDSVSTLGAVGAYPLRRAWVEGTKDNKAEGDSANWSQPHDNDLWVAEGGDYENSVLDIKTPAGAGAWLTLDLTRIAEDWLVGRQPNHGVLLKASDSVIVRFASSDTPTAANRPRLVLNYVCECGQAC